MQELDFRLYEIEFLTKQARPLPLRDWSRSLFKTVLLSLLSLNPMTVAFVSLAM